jgi:hypothetical protein
MIGVLQRGRLFVLLTLPLFFVASSARAQERGFAGGLGAVTFGTVTGATVAGRAGFNASSHVQIFGELGRMSDVLPKSDQQTIENNATAIVSDDGTTTATVLGRMPTTYGSGGVRYIAAPHGRVTPFAEGAFGFAHITNNLTATLGGTDVSSQVLTTPFTSITNETDPIMFLGGGVSVAAGKRTAFDVGYSYSRIFITDQDINSGHIYGGLRVGF